MSTRLLEPKIVTRAEWTAARVRLLAKEKELDRMRDALSAERRALPMVRVEAEYVFDGPDGPRTLLDLFDGRRQLAVYHFMFDPEWDEACPSCAFVADNLAGAVAHLAGRDTAFAAVSRAPLAKLERFRKRMGWSFPWVSSFGNDFNRDFRVTLDARQTEYNFAPVDAQPEHYPREGEREGLSVFLRDGDAVLHSYSTYQRGLDALLATYHVLDRTPLGRQEEDGIMRWIRFRGEYGAGPR